MRMTKLELAILMVTALTLTAMLFYFLGSQSVEAPVTVMTRETVSPSGTTQENIVSSEPERESISPAISEESPSVEPTAPADTPAPADSSEPPDSSFPININTATASELMLLPGIGESRAAAIINDRNENGPFLSVKDITRVKGIGNGILDGMIDYITV